MIQHLKLTRSVCQQSWACCYIELTVSSLMVAKVITSTHCAYPLRMARLSWPGWLVIYQDVCLPEDGHPSSTNQAWCIVDQDQYTTTKPNCQCKFKADPNFTSISCHWWTHAMHCITATVLQAKVDAQCHKLATELSWQHLPYLSKVTNFNLPHLHLAPPLEWPRLSCANQKTRVPGIACGIVCVILHLAISVEHWLVTDRHTTTAYTALAWRHAVKKPWQMQTINQNLYKASSLKFAEMATMSTHAEKLDESSKMYDIFLASNHHNTKSLVLLTNRGCKIQHYALKTIFSFPLAAYLSLC